MSGGSYGYAFGRVRDVACDPRLTEGSEPRRRLARHLGLVADAMRAVEWVDSGDDSPGDEDEAIRAVFADAGGDEAVEDRARTLLEAYPESLWPDLAPADVERIPGEWRSRLYCEAARRVLRQVLGAAEATPAVRAGWRKVAGTTARTGEVWLFEPVGLTAGSARVDRVDANCWQWQATAAARVVTDDRSTLTEHVVIGDRSTLAEAQEDAEAQLRAWDALPGGAR